VTRDLRIFEASIGDAEEISALAIRTYVHAFGADFEPGDLTHHLEKTISVSRWREHLARDRVLMARIGGRAIAYLQFGSAKTAREIEVRRLYVDAEFQGRGIGTALLERALASPEVVAAPAVVIDVWEKNEGARRLYERFGFRHEGGVKPFVLKSGAIDGYDLILVRRSRSA
jgi:diamine N-acetyltransferase